MPFFGNGTGQERGDTFATCEPLLTSGAMWFVNSATGDDNYPGDDTRPFATLATAIAAASENDIIVLMDGHEETFQEVDLAVDGVTVVGGGSSGGVPTVELTPGQTEGDGAFVVSAAGCAIRNVRFKPRADGTHGDASTVNVTGAGFHMSGCYLEGDQYDATALLRLATGADSARIEDTTFISVATSLAAQPDTGLLVAAAVSDLTLEGVVFSNGAYGFNQAYALKATAAAITRLKMLSCSLLLGADVGLHADTTGYVNAQTVTGGSHVSWTGV